MNEEKPIQQRESVKLSKMSKGYNWEIKILDTPGKQITSEDIERLDELNKIMIHKYEYQKVGELK